jgi:hypothetical protein
MTDEGTKLIVPKHLGFGHAPLREERLKTVDTAVLEGTRSPSIGLSTGERPVLMDDEGEVSRSPIPKEEMDFGKTRTRARALSQNLDAAGDRDMGSPGSVHSEQDEIRRLEGNLVAREAQQIVQRLRSETPQNAPPPPPRVRETRATTANRLQGREGQLEAIDEDADYEDAVDEEVEPRAKHTAATKTGCRCRDQNSVLVKMMGKMAANKKLSDPARVKLIDEYYRECRSAGKSTNRVCYNHLQFLASKMGLKTRPCGQRTLHEMLYVMYAQKKDWGRLQANAVTGILFTAPFRGTPQNQDLKSYRYRPATVKAKIHWGQVRGAMGVGDKYDEFKQTGTITLNIFEWVTEDEELMAIIEEAYNMYDYHTRLIDGNPNLGWCRVMYHSVVQQLVRGDPLYWLWYAMLREETNLISYPYYTKYTRPGDSTYFRHIDLNIADAVYTGRGVDIIQGSVSWDDEDDDNCTEMFEGFYRIIADYQAWRRYRGMSDSTGKIEG